MPLRVCSLRVQELSAEAASSEGLPGLPGPPGGGRHSPLADRLAALKVGRQVAHAVHSLHQFPQVRLDLHTRCLMGPRSPGSPVPWCLHRPAPIPPGSCTSSMARISRRSLSITVMKSCGQCVHEATLTRPRG